MAGETGGSAFGVTLERGADGTYLAWVDDLPGCAFRGGTREDVLAELPGAISSFLSWAGAPEGPEPVRVEVVEELESAIDADEDTEVLLRADRKPLTAPDWSSLARLLERSRGELLALLEKLGEHDLDETREPSERTVREEIEHLAFVELMYAAWTFDLGSRRGLADFLAWTRRVAAERMCELAAAGADDETLAHWGGAPRPEPRALDGAQGRAPAAVARAPAPSRDRATRGAGRGSRLSALRLRRGSASGFTTAEQGKGRGLLPEREEDMADWDEVEGKAKEVGGDVTGDESMKREGQAQEAWGSAKDDTGDALDEAKDKAGDAVDDVKDRF